MSKNVAHIPLSLQVEDEDAMGHMVAQINNWNFDMFKFATISKDHPLVSLSYTVLQVHF